MRAQMPDPWLIFAPLQPDGIVPTYIRTPYHFSELVSVRQRGTNENTSRLLRQGFPKSTDLLCYFQADVAPTG